MVKLAGSMAAFPNAIRHRTELAAKAINANRVKLIVFNVVLIFNEYFSINATEVSTYSTSFDETNDENFNQWILLQKL